MLPTWKERYSVHHTGLDAQHKELFNLAGKVYSLDMNAFTKEKARELFASFYGYMKKHFVEEQEYMESINYPKLEEHKEQHNEIVEGMNAILQKSHSYLEMREAMKKIVKDWLVDHILVHDLEYERWRKEKNKIDLTK